MVVSPDASRKRTPLDLDISSRRRSSCLLWATELLLAQAIISLALVSLPEKIRVT